MSLVHASIIPDLPTLLAPGNTDASLVKDAVREVEGELYVMQPETAIVISPEVASTNAFYVHVAPEFELNVTNIDGAIQPRRFPADLELISRLRSSDSMTMDEALPVHALDQSRLDQSVAIALHQLTQHIPQLRLVPCSISPLSIDMHRKFGQFIHSTAVQTNKRVAVVLPLHVSLLPNADANSFNALVQEYITTGKLDSVLSVNPTVATNAQVETTIKSLAVLAGILSAVEYSPRLLTKPDPANPALAGAVVAEFIVI